MSKPSSAAVACFGPLVQTHRYTQSAASSSLWWSFAPSVSEGSVDELDYNVPSAIMLASLVAFGGTNVFVKLRSLDSNHKKLTESPIFLEALNTELPTQYQPAAAGPRFTLLRHEPESHWGRRSFRRVIPETTSLFQALKFALRRHTRRTSSSADEQTSPLAHQLDAGVGAIKQLSQAQDASRRASRGLGRQTPGVPLVAPNGVAPNGVASNGVASNGVASISTANTAFSQTKNPTELRTVPPIESAKRKESGIRVHPFIVLRSIERYPIIDHTGKNHGLRYTRPRNVCGTFAARTSGAPSKGTHRWRVAWHSKNLGSHAAVGVCSHRCNLSPQPTYRQLVGERPFSWGVNLVEGVRKGRVQCDSSLRSYYHCTREVMKTMMAAKPECDDPSQSSGGGLNFDPSNIQLSINCDSKLVWLILDGPRHFNRKYLIADLYSDLDAPNCLYPAISCVGAGSQIEVEPGEFGNVDFRETWKSCVAHLGLEPTIMRHQIRLHSFVLATAANQLRGAQFGDIPRGPTGALDVSFEIPSGYQSPLNLNMFLGAVNLPFLTQMPGLPGGQNERTGDNGGNGGTGTSSSRSLQLRTPTEVDAYQSPLRAGIQTPPMAPLPPAPPALPAFHPAAGPWWPPVRAGGENPMTLPQLQWPSEPSGRVVSLTPHAELYEPPTEETLALVKQQLSDAFDVFSQHVFEGQLRSLSSSG